jgi:hypothetical protein
MAKGSHVIDVGSATANAPGHWANRLVNTSIPAKSWCSNKLVEHLTLAAGL